MSTVIADVRALHVVRDALVRHRDVLAQLGPQYAPACAQLEDEIDRAVASMQRRMAQREDARRRRLNDEENPVNDDERHSLTQARYADEEAYQEVLRLRELFHQTKDALLQHVQKLSAQHVPGLTVANDHMSTMIAALERYAALPFPQKSITPPQTSASPTSVSSGNGSVPVATTYQQIYLTNQDQIVRETRGNTVYYLNDMQFRTDSYGRTVEVIVANLSYGNAPRRQLPRILTGSEPTTSDPNGNTVITENYTSTNLRNQPRTYYADGGEILDTQNGHIVANHLGGPPHAFNLVPQSVYSNLVTYQRDVENPIDEIINMNPGVRLIARYLITYTNDREAPHFYAPRDMLVCVYRSSDVGGRGYDGVAPIHSFHHRHYYDPDFHDTYDSDAD